MIKLLPMCKKECEWDANNSGWYVHNSIYVRDIYPVWRRTGGGVTEVLPFEQLNASYDKAIAFTKQRIRDAESHLKKLENAKAEFNQRR